ncbi:MAG: NAD-dependent epimerase/dehydratase family protein [Actinomycetota bacterium]
MRLLVLGGTRFLGRALVEEALRRGHDVALFNRGLTNPGLFSEAEQVVGDRDGDLSALEGRTWDAVIDTCGYVPRVVRSSAELLADSVGTYVFVSSGSVYREGMPFGYDETWPTEELEDPATEDVGAHYGALKAACERAVEAVMPGRVLHVRAGLIVGRHDHTGRFTYWAHRVARGGEVLAPEPRTQPVQFIDVQDVTAWMLDAAERGLTGTFNATGPEEPLTMESFLEGMCQALGADCTFVWAGEMFLREHDVTPWSDMPLWLAPASDPGTARFLSMDVRRAVDAGLGFRSLAETARDALELARPTADAGLTPERERELLRAWLS